MGVPSETVYVCFPQIKRCKLAYSTSFKRVCYLWVSQLFKVALESWAVISQVFLQFQLHFSHKQVVVALDIRSRKWYTLNSFDNWTWIAPLQDIRSQSGCVTPYGECQVVPMAILYSTVSFCISVCEFHKSFSFFIAFSCSEDSLFSPTVHS